LPTKAKPRITAWSYSRYAAYTKCPFSAKCKFIDKLPEPDSPALARGSDIHKEAEDYSTGLLKRLPKSLALFKDEFRDLRKRKASLNVEGQFAVDKEWNEVGWFASNAWLRAMIDCFYDYDRDGERVRKVIDYKTGKIRPENMAQLDLYALVMFAVDESIDRVEAEFWYLDQGEIRTKLYSREHMPELQATWAKKVKPMLTDTSFPPTPCNVCRWCTFSKAKNGPCKF
jgi:RecB family exonuclease